MITIIRNLIVTFKMLVWMLWTRGGVLGALLIQRNCLCKRFKLVHTTDIFCFFHNFGLLGFQAGSWRMATAAPGEDDPEQKNLLGSWSRMNNFIVLSCNLIFYTDFERFWSSEAWIQDEPWQRNNSCRDDRRTYNLQAQTKFSQGVVLRSVNQLESGTRTWVRKV